MAATGGDRTQQLTVLDGVGEPAPPSSSPDAEWLTDPDGHRYLLLPADVTPHTAAQAALTTALGNKGSAYEAIGGTDYSSRSFDAVETRRIRLRQVANRWSYRFLPWMSRHGARFVTTPEGILLGLGLSWCGGVLTQRGGTIWGDVFLLNIDRCDDPAEALRTIVATGLVPRTPPSDGAGDDLTFTRRSLARLLHHEEIHAQQWADRGVVGFALAYLRDLVTRNETLEAAAGLGDGGYR
ncbi:MAG: hypothetical protein LBM23_04650 [Propionibacteriaceae bacterium]|jgi:hypothetical protein|nr:hypothetical protein [Propionibacteriaceae bacterium]